MLDEEQIGKAKAVRSIIEDIEKEMNSEDTHDHIKALSINHTICKFSSAFCMPLLFTAVAITCGTIGKVALAVYVISRVAATISHRHEHMLAKRMNEKMEKYSKRLKEAGVESQFMGTHFDK